MQAKEEKVQAMECTVLEKEKGLDQIKVRMYAIQILH